MLGIKMAYKELLSCSNIIELLPLFWKIDSRIVTKKIFNLFIKLVYYLMSYLEQFN